MEKHVFVEGLGEIKSKLIIKHVVTDRHPGINAYMRTAQEEPRVAH